MLQKVTEAVEKTPPQKNIGEIVAFVSLTLKLHFLEFPFKDCETLYNGGKQPLFYVPFTPKSDGY